MKIILLLRLFFFVDPVFVRGDEQCIDSEGGYAIPFKVSNMRRQRDSVEESS